MIGERGFARWMRRRVSVGPLGAPLWLLALVVVVVLAGASWFLLFSGSDVPAAQRAEQLVIEGLQAQTAGDVDTAVDKYEEAIRVDSTNALAHYDLGTALQAQGDTPGAIDAFKAAARLDPSMTAAFYNLGILFTDSDPEVAVEYYRQAISADATNANAHINLGFLLRTLGQTAEGDTEVALGTALVNAASGSTTTIGGPTTSGASGGSTTVAPATTTVATSQP